MKLKTHTCAATGCQHQIPGHLLMCMDHWRMVPVALRREVLRTHREVQHGRAPDRVDYRAAVANAVAALADKQNQKMNELAEKFGDLFDTPDSQDKNEHGNTKPTGRQPA